MDLKCVAYLGMGCHRVGLIGRGLMYVGKLGGGYLDTTVVVLQTSKATMEANRPLPTNRMRSILEEQRIVVDESDATGQEDVSTLTSRTTRVSWRGTAADYLPRSNGGGAAQEVSVEKFQEAMTVVRMFELQSKQKSRLTAVHLAMLRKHVNLSFFPRFKFLPSKGSLMDRMRDEMEHVFQHIEVFDIELMENFAFDLQKKLRFMVSQRRSFVVSSLFDVYKGEFVGGIRLFAHRI